MEWWIMTLFSASAATQSKCNQSKMVRVVETWERGKEQSHHKEKAEIEHWLGCEGQRDTRNYSSFTLHYDLCLAYSLFNPIRGLEDRKREEEKKRERKRGLRHTKWSLVTSLCTVTSPLTQQYSTGTSNYVPATERELSFGRGKKNRSKREGETNAHKETRDAFYDISSSYSFSSLRSYKSPPSRRIFSLHKVFIQWETHLTTNGVNKMYTPTWCVSHFNQVKGSLCTFFFSPSFFTHHKVQV